MNTQVKIHLVLAYASPISYSTQKLSERKIRGRRVLTCASRINYSTLKLTGRERGVISKASATGMSPLSPQGWVHGDFVFTPLSQTLPPIPPDDLQNSSHKLSLTLPPRHPDDFTHPPTNPTYLCLISVNSNPASADPGASGSPFCGHQTP